MGSDKDTADTVMSPVIRALQSAAFPDAPPLRDTSNSPDGIYEKLLYRSHTVPRKFPRSPTPSNESTSSHESKKVKKEKTKDIHFIEIA